MKKFKFIGNPDIYIWRNNPIKGEIYTTEEIVQMRNPTSLKDIKLENMENSIASWKDWEEVKESKTKDNINPDHYKAGKVECIDALESATVNKTGLEAVCTSNIIKYLWRYESKNGIEDIRKAKWYLEKLINHLEEK